MNTHFLGLMTLIMLVNSVVIQSFTSRPRFTTPIHGLLSIQRQTAYHSTAFRPKTVMMTVDVHTAGNSQQLTPTNKHPVALLLRSWYAKLGAIVAVVMATILTVPSRAQATASSVFSTANKVRGWDVFGRVPHDNWLFTNWRLTDPDLLKRSIVESVQSELPDVLGNFRRRKRISELSVLGSGMGYLAVAAVLLTFLYKVGMEANLKRISREDKARGFSQPTSARYKKSQRQGTEIKNMGDGWLDMEESADDDKKKTDDDDDDDEA